jgi:hypothetical protein
VNNSKPLYHGHRFPAMVISCTVGWYFRFQVSLRDIESLCLVHGSQGTWFFPTCLDTAGAILASVRIFAMVHPLTVTFRVGVPQSARVLSLCFADEAVPGLMPSLRSRAGPTLRTGSAWLTCGFTSEFG